mmetsp:Transcript_17918/g.24562  ORF Transcript_17918/g.24562 Transcript_17918/m.24562 type:complete len:112 (+) Transcript_17918:11-346(+)
MRALPTESQYRQAQKKTLLTAVTIIKVITTPPKLLNYIRSHPIAVEATAHSRNCNRSHQVTAEATSHYQDCNLCHSFVPKSLLLSLRTASVAIATPPKPRGDSLSGLQPLP